MEMRKIRHSELKREVEVPASAVAEWCKKGSGWSPVEEPKAPEAKQSAEPKSNKATPEEQAVYKKES